MNFSAVFAAPEHQPFLWEAGKPAALLVHGFPGTPAEMRPLAATLHQAGWTVQGLLLPGFGADLDNLAQRTYANWVDAVTAALAALQARHSPTILAGFSMGSAVSAAAAAERRPDGLALMAPFWKMAGPLWAVLPVMRRIFPVIQPFRLFKPDFSDPEVRKGIDNFLPGLDLNDSAVQQAVREFNVPTSIIEEVRRVGMAAGRAAPTLRLPTLVLQGAHDRVVRPNWTQELVGQLPGPVRYRELNAAHDLLNAAQPAWPEVQRHVLRFAAQLVHRTPAPLISPGDSAKA